MDLALNRGGAARERIARILSQPHPAKYVVSRVFWRTGIGKLLGITARVDGRFRVSCDRSAFAAQLFADPSWRLRDRELIRRLVDPGDAVIDVGANVGMLSLTAAMAVGTDGFVVAVEPHGQTFESLRRNIRLNGMQQTITAERVAVASEDANLFMSNLRSDDQNYIADDQAAATELTAVPGKRLDDLESVCTGRAPALLKIDVEGYEIHALSGALQTLARTKRVLFECWDRHLERFGYTGLDLIHFLEQQGFTIVDPDRPDRPVDRETIGAVCSDLLAVRDVADVRRRLAGFAVDEHRGVSLDSQ